jgi:HK97 gp10 family phage protein
MAGLRPLTTAGYWRQYLPTLQDKAQARAEEIAELIVQEIALSPVTPRETGNLATSFSVVTDPGTGDVLITTTASYWVFVEYGARGRAPQPFLRSALHTVDRAFD